MKKREFAVGVVLASVCLLVALIQVGWFMLQIADQMKGMSDLVDKLAKDPGNNALTLRYAVSARIALMQQSLLASGVIVGVAFGVVGFALFVMGITGAAEMEGKAASYSVALKNAAPGLVLLVVAAVLIAICVTQRVAVEYTPTAKPPATESPATDSKSSRAERKQSRELKP